MTRFGGLVELNRQGAEDAKGCGFGGIGFAQKKSVGAVSDREGSLATPQ
jgi:hypothetical protein